MANELNGLSVAILIDNGFEEVEMTKPRQALDEAGAKTSIVSPAGKEVRAWNMKEWSKSYPVDIPLEQADAEQFDALLLPGGVINPDKLRMRPEAVEFVKSFFDAGKPVAAIGHGPWMVVESVNAEGRRITSWPSLKTDIRNAGGEWTDQPVVNDRNLVTSRKPDDIPQFNEAIIKLFAEGRKDKRRVA